MGWKLSGRLRPIWAIRIRVQFCAVPPICAGRAEPLLGSDAILPSDRAISGLARADHG